MPSRFLTAIFVLLCLPSRLGAQDKLLTLDDLYDPKTKINFSGSPPTGLRWLRDGEHYLHRKTEEGTTTWLKVHALTGESRPFFDAERMQSAFVALPGFSGEEARKMVGRGSFELNPDETGFLVHHSRDLFYYSLTTERAVRLTHSPQEEQEAGFSPDGKMVSFVRDYNLYVVEVAGGPELQLTMDGHSELLNGLLDWVYQEEIYGRGNFKGYWWSPDSTRIAYLQLDESPVSRFTVVDHMPTRLRTEVTPYPKAGDANPRVRLGFVTAAGGPAAWVDTSKYPNQAILIVRVGWTPDGRHVVYQVQDREQTWLELNFADIQASRDREGTANSRTLVRETSPAWVNELGDPTWLKDGSFLWFSERSGFKHLYHYSAPGELLRAVTSGSWEVQTLHGIDEGKGWIYFSGTEFSAVELHVYRVGLDGNGLARLSAERGRHQANFNRSFSHFIDSWSDVNSPSQVYLYHADGSPARVIDENRVDALKQYKLGKPEFLQVKTRDGFVMEAMMIKPPDFDPTRKYPVMSYTYSGPHAPSVRNSWGGVTYMWHQFLAQRGYVIWVCDNRTASGKGAQSTWPVHKNFGKLELQDLEDGLHWLRSQPYIDGSRIGLWGWSYGGFMTSYALTHSKSFKIGIAGAPVTDWTLYDTIYTERYLSTPQNNPEGYEKSSVIRAAANLHGKLLLIHGTMDDNVHLQNTVQLVYELQKAGQQFELMIYPKSRHGVSDPVLVKHLRTLMTNFILENL